MKQKIKNIMTSFWLSQFQVSNVTPRAYEVSSVAKPQAPLGFKSRTSGTYFYTK